MNPTERQRHGLRESLTAAIGVEHTEVLMESIPPYDWSQIATKDDLLAMESRLESRLEMKFELMLTKGLHSQFGMMIAAMMGMQAITIGVLAWIVR